MKKYLCILLSALLAACGTKNAATPVLPDAEAFETTVDGKPVALYTLANSTGFTVQITNFGARVVSILAPDRNGRMADVAVGCESIGRYLDEGEARFSGPVVGRFANRIAEGCFTLDGTQYRLPQNDNGQSLHGGVKGLDSRVWTVDSHSADSIVMHYVSPDGEEGYPGELTVQVTYAVTDDNALRIGYRARTDRPTVVNLSNHTYFNLKGQNGGYVMDHELQVEADHYFRNTAQYVPDGAMLPVEDTPFDMRSPHRIDYAIDTPDPQLQIMRGFSVCWALRSQTGELTRAANLYSPRSGRGVETWTTEPGLLTYTGRGLNGRMIGKNGVPLEKFGGMLLETIHFADSPNRPDFPSTVLRPGERYRSVTEFRFYTK